MALSPFLTGLLVNVSGRMITCHRNHGMSNLYRAGHLGHNHHAGVVYNNIAEALNDDLELVS